MSRARNLSGESSDMDNDEEIMKLFASEDEVSFSGFSEPVENTVLSPSPPETNSGESQTKKMGKGKGPGKKSTKKRSESAPVDEQIAGPSTAPDPSGTPATKKRKRISKQEHQDQLLKSLFNDLSSNIVKAIEKKSDNPACSTRPNINERVRMHMAEARRVSQIGDDHVNNVENYDIESEEDHESDINSEIENFNNFTEKQDGSEVEDQDANDDADGHNIAEYEYQMPRVFEDDEKFDTKVSDSIASIVQNVCKKKSDVSSYSDKYKIPINCKNLVPPPVNMEIWQFLERKAKGDDLSCQNVQKLIGIGIVPVIKCAEMLGRKTCNMEKVRELMHNAITILSAAHFEMSIKRRLSLKPHIERKYTQLCNRNEQVGGNLFGDDIGKRLQDINTVHKINKNISSKNFRGGRGRPPFGRRTGQTPFRGRSNYSPRMNSQGRTNFPTGTRGRSNWQNKKRF